MDAPLSRFRHVPTCVAFICVALNCRVTSCFCSALNSGALTQNLGACVDVSCKPLPQSEAKGILGYGLHDMVAMSSAIAVHGWCFSAWQLAIQRRLRRRPCRSAQRRLRPNMLVLAQASCMPLIVWALPCWRIGGAPDICRTYGEGADTKTS